MACVSREDPDQPAHRHILIKLRSLDLWLSIEHIGEGEGEGVCGSDETMLKQGLSEPSLGTHARKRHIFTRRGLCSY